jgi:hypothetical protein
MTFTPQDRLEHLLHGTRDSIYGSAADGFNYMDHETPAEDIMAVVDLAKDAFRGKPFNVPHTVVEVGTWAGLTALALARLGCNVFCVDHWQGNPGDRLGELAKMYGPQRAINVFCKNLERHLFRNVFPLVGPSMDWAARWPTDLPVDLVFIDASHEHEDVLADISAWWPRVAEGGIMCGHDWHPEFPGVQEAVVKFFGRAAECTGPVIGQNLDIAGKSVWWVKK